MKFSNKSIENTKRIIESDISREKYKLSEKDFIRNRKLSFKNVVYCIL